METVPLGVRGEMPSPMWEISLRAVAKGEGVVRRRKCARTHCEEHHVVAGMKQCVGGVEGAERRYQLKCAWALRRSQTNPLETAGTTIVIHKGSQGNMMDYADVQARVQAQAGQKGRGLLLQRT